MHNDTANVVRVLKDGPAKKAGIQPGDRILLVDTLVVNRHDPMPKLLTQSRGVKTRRLSERYYRPFTGKTIEQTIERGTVKTPSVYASLIDEQTSLC